MKVSELMIGDWVYSSFSSHPCKITHIGSFGDEYIEVGVTGVWGLKDIASLTPIPLTQDILEKNGFKPYSEASLFCLDEKRELYIDVLDGEIANYFRNISGDYEWHLIAYCKYVHELRHALKLCGIEKDIEL